MPLGSTCHAHIPQKWAQHFKRKKIRFHFTDEYASRNELRRCQRWEHLTLNFHFKIKRKILFILWRILWWLFPFETFVSHRRCVGSYFGRSVGRSVWKQKVGESFDKEKTRGRPFLSLFRVLFGVVVFIPSLEIDEWTVPPSLFSSLHQQREETECQDLS